MRSRRVQTKFLKPKAYISIAIIVLTTAMPVTLCFIARQNEKSQEMVQKSVEIARGVVRPVYADEGTKTHKMTLIEQSRWESFVQKAHELAPLYDYPIKVILAQAALESAHGTSPFAVERNNFFGFTCYDRSPAKDCASFDSIEEGIIEYMRLIKYHYPEAYAQRSNPDKMIQLIWEGGYATDPLYVEKIKALKEWK